MSKYYLSTISWHSIFDNSFVHKTSKSHITRTVIELINKLALKYIRTIIFSTRYKSNIVQRIGWVIRHGKNWLGQYLHVPHQSLCSALMVPLIICAKE